MTTARSHRRPARFIALTSGLAIMLALVVVELGARWLVAAPEVPTAYSNLITDPILPWKLRPGGANHIVSPHGEFEFDYSYNSRGFRDGEHTLQKPAGVLRIVGIGDSFTYGAGVNMEDTYLARLERRLNEVGSVGVEIIKMGIPRYWPEPERLLLEHYGLAYEPDLVTVGIVPNDVWDTQVGIEGLRVSDGFLVTRRAERLGRLAQWLYTHSYGARTMLYNLLKAQDPVAAPRGEKEAWERIYTELRKMVALARGAGAKIVFVHIPRRPPWGGAAYTMPQRLKAFCMKEDCLFVDVQPEMEKHPAPKNLYFVKDSHCNAAGHDLIANTLFRELRSQLP